jgi:hypothetical protein
VSHGDSQATSVDSLAGAGAEEVQDELAHHLELRTLELVERGWTPDAARAEAARRLGGVEARMRRLGERRNCAFAC